MGEEEVSGEPFGEAVQRRGFCPSYAAKRGALVGAFLSEEVLENVGLPVDVHDPEDAPAVLPTSSPSRERI